MFSGLALGLHGKTFGSEHSVESGPETLTASTKGTKFRIPHTLNPSRLLITIGGEAEYCLHPALSSVLAPPPPSFAFFGHSYSM